MIMSYAKYLEVDCPSCGVEAGKYCVRVNGANQGDPYSSSYFHTARKITLSAFSNGQVANNKMVADMLSEVARQMGEIQSERDAFKSKLERIAEILLED